MRYLENKGTIIDPSFFSILYNLLVLKQRDYRQRLDDFDFTALPRTTSSKEAYRKIQAEELGNTQSL